VAELRHDLVPETSEDLRFLRFGSTPREQAMTVFPLVAAIPDLHYAVVHFGETLVMWRPEGKITAYRGLLGVLHRVGLPENCCLGVEERLKSSRDYPV
jgi:hypothetical protein